MKSFDQIYVEMAMQQGRYDKAEELIKMSLNDWRKSYKTQPKSELFFADRLSKALCYYANFLRSRGREDDAKDSLNEALLLWEDRRRRRLPLEEREWSWACFHYGNLLRSQGKSVAAQMYVDEAVRMNPGLPQEFLREAIDSMADELKCG